MKRSRRADCPTRKIRYRDWGEAKKALDRIRTTKGPIRHNVPVRCYECGMCRGWHLTSQEHHEAPTYDW